MFSNLTEKLQRIFRDIAGYGKLTEKNIEEALRNIRVSLLEADVNYKVVKSFIESVKEKAVGKEIYKKISPAQMLVKIVYDELVSILGTGSPQLNLNGAPSVIMLAGLHGCGKTTTCAKLAKYLTSIGKKPLLVSLDTQRPAAQTQLQTLGKEISVPVFEFGSEKNAIKICEMAIGKARVNGNDVVILDTAGRWHIEKELVSELKELKKRFSPQETILVVDSTGGQDAVNVAKEFNTQVGLDSVFLTKADGDSRGGAAVSALSVTGKPIKFIGVGEHVNDLEEFHPDRIASRILGMGDIITLVEKEEESRKEEDKKKQKKHEIDLEDFMKSIRQIKKIAPMADFLKMMPMGGIFNGAKTKAGEELSRIEAIISSMTKEERSSPEILDGSRRKRIASGSGTTPHDVNLLLTRFDKMKESMKKMQKGTGPKGFGISRGGFPF